MNYKTMSRRALIAALGMLALAGFSPPARAAVPPDTMPGRWSGYGESAVTGREIVPCVDILTPGKNRRLQGTLEIVPCIFPIDITVSAAGIVNGGGTDEHGHRVDLHGKVRTLGNGPVRIMALRFEIRSSQRGVEDEGYMALIQMIGGADWNHNMAGANVTGQWKGGYTPEGGQRVGAAMTANLANLRSERADGGATTALGGTLHMDPTNAVGDFEVRGTVGPAGPAGVHSPVAVICEANRYGYIAILFGLAAPPDSMPAIRGEYRLYDSFFDVFLEVFHGTDSSFDKGTFEIMLSPPV